ncbi:restriction endonuclease subunit R, partial [Klebsiella pneumoniae]
ELRLRPLGIKVLSLFFIDAVEMYRQYDASGQPVKGVYATIFEEEYRRASKLPAYQSLFEGTDTEVLAQSVHNGYFSIDKRVITPFSELELKKSAKKEDIETSSYNLIMKEKEKLLSFETPLQFIFSHSALKEGWDNPNIFQICTLRDIQSERERRQTIGRGLRLCVNQQGERVRGFDVNTLTVIATESYEQFAEQLQTEVERDTGIRFGIVESHQFAGIPVADADGKTAPM